MSDYEAEKGSPMPFWQEASYANGQLRIGWDESISLEGKWIEYNLTVATDVNMSNIILEEYSIDKNDSRITYNEWGSFIYTKSIVLAPGRYYLKIQKNIR